MYVHTCKYNVKCIFMHTHTHTRTHACTHARMHAHTHAHTHCILYPKQKHPGCKKVQGQSEATL